MKKAYELSVLCDCEIAVVIFDSHQRNYIYGSHELGTTLSRYVDFKDDPVESHNNETIAKVLYLPEHLHRMYSSFPPRACFPVLTHYVPPPYLYLANQM